MDVVLIDTEGRGLRATIEVDGETLTVVDAMSTSEEAAPPGLVADPKFDVVINESQSSISPAQTGIASDRKLEHQWGYRYLGRGEVVSVDPLRADLGVLTLELTPRILRADRVGDVVAVAIDRILLSGVRT